jgi:5'-nucleotidase
MPRHTRRAWFVLVLCIATVLAAPGSAQNGVAAPQGDFIVLLSNDDGYNAPGIAALAKAFESIGTVYVVAPATNQSGKGHSILTTRDPIFAFEHKRANGPSWYSIEAPPATCARVAIEALLPRKPDVVVSGVNAGDNLGISVYLSGTVGAAREAAMVGVPAIAISMQGNKAEDFANAAAYARKLVDDLRAKKMLKPGLFLNVNTPSGEWKGVRMTRLSLRPSNDKFERRTSPRGRVYFWSLYEPPTEGDAGTDVWAFERGFVTITPMTLDPTSPRQMRELRGLERVPASK